MPLLIEWWDGKSNSAGKLWGDKRKCEKFYKNVESVWCPALKDEVVFKDDGFKHLIWSKQWRRSKKEQLKRLSLLKQAPEIIKHAEKWNEYRMEERDVTIRVIVRQVGKGKKNFLSIFARDENMENKKRLSEWAAFYHARFDYLPSSKELPPPPSMFI